MPRSDKYKGHRIDVITYNVNGDETGRVSFSTISEALDYAKRKSQFAKWAIEKREEGIEWYLMKSGSIVIERKY